MFEVPAGVIDRGLFPEEYEQFIARLEAAGFGVTVEEPVERRGLPEAMAAYVAIKGRGPRDRSRDRLRH